MDDLRLLAALRNEESWAFDWIYKHAYRRAATMVLDRYGQESDAEDMFQEALFVLLKKLQMPGFQLTSSLVTYLCSVTRNLWLYKSRNIHREVKAGDITVFEKNENTGEDEHQMVEDRQESESRYAAALSALDRLGDDCRQIILRSYYDNQPDRDIATLLGFAVDYVKVKRHRCMSQLKSLLPKF